MCEMFFVQSARMASVSASEVDEKNGENCLLRRVEKHYTPNFSIFPRKGP